MYQDIPFFYRNYNELRRLNYSNRLSERTSEVVRNWTRPFELEPIPNWSNDWFLFDEIGFWIHPYPRWGLVDETIDVHNNQILTIRQHIRTIGDVNLVMYNKSNHTHIIFRVGERMYVYKTEMDGDDDYELDEEECFIGILPYTYSQCLNEPHLLYSCIRNKAVVNNLKDIQFGAQELAQPMVAAAFRSELGGLYSRYGKDINLASTREWPDEQWNGLQHS